MICCGSANVLSGVALIRGPHRDRPFGDHTVRSTDQDRLFSISTIIAGSANDLLGWTRRFDCGAANGRYRRLGDEVGFYDYGPSPGGYAHWLPVSGRRWIGVTPRNGCWIHLKPNFALFL